MPKNLQLLILVVTLSLFRTYFLEFHFRFPAGIELYRSPYVVQHVTLCVCVCVCVFFPFILDIKFVGRTSRGHIGGRSHRIFHPPSFCAVRALIFLARRIQPLLSLVDREVEFCVLTNLIVLHPLGIFILVF